MYHNHNPIIRSKAEQIQKYVVFQETLISRFLIKMTVEDRETVVTDAPAGGIRTI
jgi:hypothetical protein